MKPLRIAIIGYGKIAADQHAPAIRGLPRFELAATVSRSGRGIEGVPNFTSHQALLEAGLDLDAVAITTPPDVRREIACACIHAGLHVLLEKPPATTVGEAEDIVRAAAEKGITLMATWHAQENAGVAAAREALSVGRPSAMRVTWREDVRKWHPGQDWVWQVGGFGVFDPGINALSILTRILPGPVFVRKAVLQVPEGRDMPIAAQLTLSSPVVDGPIPVDLDWREQGDERWEIAWTSEGRSAVLSGSGAKLALDGAEVDLPESAGEYPRLYARFLDLIDCRTSDPDLAPLRMVADAFMLAQREVVEPFSG